MKKFLLSTLSLVAILASCGENGSSSENGKGNTISNPWWTTTGTLEKKDGEIVYDEINVSLASVVTTLSNSLTMNTKAESPLVSKILDRTPMKKRFLIVLAKTKTHQIC